MQTLSFDARMPVSKDRLELVYFLHNPGVTHSAPIITPHIPSLGMEQRGPSAQVLLQRLVLTSLLLQMVKIG
jgi:hypothetical protein